MIKFQDLTIRKKLTLILMGTSTFAVLLACFAFYYLTINYYQQFYRNELTSLAKVVGFNSQAALAFAIPEDAEKVLASLGNHPSIISARITDNTGELFARYGDSDSASVSPEEVMVIYQDIMVDGSVIGQVSLTDDLRNIHAFKKMAMITLFIIVVVVLALSFLLAAKLRELISQPIAELAALSQQVSGSQDYTLRAARRSADEIGNLAEAFNGMLGKIEERNKDLIKSEYRFRSLVNQAVDAFFLYDVDGCLVDVNEQACDLLGYSREELLNLTVADIDLEVDNQRYIEKFWDHLRPETPITLEGVHRRKDGETFPVELRVGVLELDDQKFVMSLARDITDRLQAIEDKQQMEAQLQQAQKMESIGTLAGGIAHDFNNILTAVLGYTELALMKVEPGSGIAEDLKSVHAAGHRARELVAQILTFSRRQAHEKQPLQISLVVKEAMKLLRSSIPTTIEIRQDIASEGMILADPIQIHQLVMNLCTNAYHAMLETGGLMAVALREVTIDQGGVRGIDLPAGRYLKFEVSDTGCGMNEETRAKIFEPYFTTKEKGKGTGLGLAVVHGIVKSHHGRISVYSEPDQGTTFCVYLPMTSGEEDNGTSPVEIVEARGGNERVMVVDDEQSIRLLTEKLLVGAGYQVDLFNNGKEAWEAFSQEPEAWDLIITDQTMPGLTGAGLTEKVISQRPDFPVILCTGYSEMISAEIAQQIGVASFLQKPLSKNELLSNVRRVLDERTRKG
ncbi:MAG: PAS domain S-box protein [Proteobacteria bacterium]|nr:PAS domain S-box protein [Pseudomonadota bacterium]MBU1714240.1 PAS domain S-box protein [Pseudomonadota bacterium]